ncbi:hypothetical protein ACLMJK_000645 [Lecanora helva]
MANQDIVGLRQRFDSLKGAENNKNELIEDRNAFVLVLIDGDGMIFNDHLTAQGEAGGREAAGSLWNSVSEYVQKLNNIPSDYKIVTRIYANLKGLGEACRKAGLIDRSERIEDFARGFTGSKQLFDFVDVGQGKDRADDKLSEIFKLHLYDCHCRRIIFGCSHDNGYARLLEDIVEPSTLGKITLLEGVPFERELAQLKFKYEATRFEGLFRPSKIDVYQQAPDPSVQERANDLLQSAPDTKSQYQLPAIPRQASTPPTNGFALNLSAPSWASTATAAPLQVASPPPTLRPAVSTNEEILRNRYGQRIDPGLKYTSDDVQRIKNVKMCSVHYLRKDCPHDPCAYEHSYKANKNELAALRFLTRLIPCYFGSECEDPKCIYGHICPQSEDGRDSCRSLKCRFPKELHGIDKTPVKLMKVGGK